MLAIQRHHKTVAILGAALVLAATSTSDADHCDWPPCPPASCMTCGPTCYSSEHGLGGHSPTYSSSRKRVAVTAYRPAVSQDPLSGVTTTTLVPCNTYEWQAGTKKDFSLWQRPIYWQSYNWHYEQPIPTTSLPLDAGSADSPYYEPSDTRLVPAPSSTPRASQPAEQQPQLDPNNFRTAPRSSTNPRGNAWRTEVRRVTPLRGLPANEPQPRAAPRESIRSAATVQADDSTTALEAWDDSGWESAHEW